jgi:hypothetical protein
MDGRRARARLDRPRRWTALSRRYSRGPTDRRSALSLAPFARSCLDQTRLSRVQLALDLFLRPLLHTLGRGRTGPAHDSTSSASLLGRIYPPLPFSLLHASRTRPRTPPPPPLLQPSLPHTSCPASSPCPFFFRAFGWLLPFDRLGQCKKATAVRWRRLAFAVEWVGAGSIVQCHLGRCESTERRGGSRERGARVEGRTSESRWVWDREKVRGV